ncbi:MAG: repeat containing protein [Acidobacteriaceae bacterium]|nr:repeat containing protein [Acidobacteriaceae bacterium]
MRKLLGAVLLLASLGQVAPAQTTPIQLPANWAKPHPYDTSNSAFREGAFLVPVRSSQMGIVFTIPATVGTPPVPVQSTSAEIKNAAGIVIRKLWQNRAYAPGQHGEIWDGLDDYGIAATGGPFTPLLQYNGVQYKWDGVMANTSPNLTAVDSWSGVGGLFPYDLVSIGGTGFTAEGYNEGGYNAVAFPIATPSLKVKLLLPQAIGGAMFLRAATDGNLIYYVSIIHATPTLTRSWIIAVDPKGYLHNFSAGTVLPRAYYTNAVTPQNYRYLIAQAADVTANDRGFITGVAVQRHGNLLASAHGKRSTAPNENVIRLFDKLTGAPIAGSAGSIAIADPQRMAFDLSGNLWVLSGDGRAGDKLSKVSGVGSTNIVSTPISGLSNPVALAISPVFGDLFVADGGANQQIFEYNVSRNKLVRTLGVPGGYGVGDTCNSAMSPYKFYFDYGGMDVSRQADEVAGQLDTFLNADDDGNLQVGDNSTGQILFYSLSKNAWRYSKRVMYQSWQRTIAAAVNDPTRLFAGQAAMMEITRDWSKDLVPGDPDPALGGNGAWTASHYWLPCIISAVGFPKSLLIPHIREVWKSPSNGNTYALVGDILNKFVWTILNPNGSVTSAHELMPNIAGFSYISPNGDQIFVQQGRATTGYVFPRSHLTGYDSANMPLYGPLDKGVPVTIDHAHGEPLGTFLVSDPTSGGITAVYDPNVNHDVSGKTPAFHLGGILPGRTSFAWTAMPQKDIAWTDGDGSFPAADLSHLAQEGSEVHTVDREIFAMYAGNYAAWGCQFFHYHEDGLFIGQFGYMTRFSATPNGQDSWGINGIPNVATGENKAPGFCGDVGVFKAFRVGTHIKIIHGDESYFPGLHEWDISGLDTITELSATGAMGSTLTLSRVPHHDQ